MGKERSKVLLHDSRDPLSSRDPMNLMKVYVSLCVSMCTCIFVIIWEYFINISAPNKNLALDILLSR